MAFLLVSASAGALAFDAQGHRGARGLAPENTLPAFERALEAGVTTLELDIGVTADGVGSPLPIDLRRTMKDKGPTLSSLTFTQLQAYDVGRINPETPYGKTFSSQVPRDGTRVPALAALFALVKARGADEVRFNIETKINPTQPDETVNPEQMVRALLNTVREAGLTRRVTIQSFDWRTLQIVQGVEPAIPTVYLSIQTANTDNIRDGAWTAGFKLADHGSLPRMVKAAGGAVWSPNGGAVTEALVKEAQAIGLKVIPWTINNPADMERLIGWGVDGIITDYPDRLRTVMQQRGLPLPRALGN
jgi:glycerophosphoryl diester phosphodiesterase